jgi:phosphatidylethanolamine/phosphatidyl-N-methylethanolamine N-methyltransferase
MSSNSDYYEFHYDEVLNSGLLGKFKAFTHRFQEKQVSKNFVSQNLIELGAGTGTHKQYVTHAYKGYLQTDLRPFPHTGVFPLNAQALTEIEESAFDRLIATCLLAHLNDPKLALDEWRRVVGNNGVVSIYVPCEPGALLRLFRLITTNIKARKRGVNHYLFHYTEHKNYYINLKYLINEIFTGDEINVKKFPLNRFSWNFNFFAIYTIVIKK